MQCFTFFFCCSVCWRRRSDFGCEAKGNHVAIYFSVNSDSWNRIKRPELGRKVGNLSLQCSIFHLRRSTVAFVKKKAKSNLKRNLRKEFLLLHKRERNFPRFLWWSLIQRFNTVLLWSWVQVAVKLKWKFSWPTLLNKDKEILKFLDFNAVEGRENFRDAKKYTSDSGSRKRSRGSWTRFGKFEKLD